MSAVSFAREVLNMQERIEYLEDEVLRLREYESKYRELLNESIGHSKHMVAGMLTLAMQQGAKA